MNSHHTCGTTGLRRGPPGFKHQIREAFMGRRVDCSNHYQRGTSEGSGLYVGIENLHSVGQVMVQKKVQLAQDLSSVAPVALLRTILEAQAALVAVFPPTTVSPPGGRAGSSSCPYFPPYGNRVKTVLPTLPGPEDHGAGERIRISSMACGRTS